jgi:hypothetical protein
MRKEELAWKISFEFLLHLQLKMQVKASSPESGGLMDKLRKFGNGFG